MPKQNVALLAFNRGVVSELALAREDIERIRLSAEEQTNWMPRVLGSMMLRPGLGYIGASRNNLSAKFIEFVFASDDTALIEVTDSTVRVWVDDTLVSRESVSSSVTNGTFDSNVSGWTDADETGATSSWKSGGYLSLLGTGTNAAKRRQQVTVAAGDQNVEHALRIVIERGPVTLRVGSTTGGDEYIRETSLGTGTHSLAFTPTGDFHIELSSRLDREVLVDSCTVESSGAMEIPAPWAEADLSKLRWAQSADIVYVACEGYQQRKIERRGTKSWSVVKYAPEDGPFRNENIGPITLTPSAISGNITLTASAPLFQSGHAGALFRITSIGQRVEVTLSAENTFSNSIRVTGVGETRRFSINISGTWTATIWLQRSIGEEGAWEDVKDYTANTSGTYLDGLDNQIVYYRIGIKSGDYTSGTAEASLDYAVGSITGVVRITGVTNETTASAEVLKDLGGTKATDFWAESVWSDYRGWPTAVNFYEGRLWWSGKTWIIGSVSDAYESFDPDYEGDAGPIVRTIASGPVDTINWLLSLQRLLIGTQGAEVSARSTSFDEPLTPFNFNLKEASTQGSAAVNAVKVDRRGLFVQRSKRRIYELAYDFEAYDYSSTDLTALCPDFCSPGVVSMAVQRQPDTRVHCVLEDGTVAVLIFDPAENTICWVKVETDGAIEDAVVLPGSPEDAVYYLVKRTIGGATKRYLEKWAREDECRGGDLCKLADSHIVYESPGTNTLSGLGHLEGKTVVIWADGKDLGTGVVSSAAVTLDDTPEKAVVGLSYDARYKSTKLLYAAGGATALTQRKRVNYLGLVLADTHAKGLQFGPDFSTLDDLPDIEGGAPVGDDAVWESYDEDAIEFPGQWDTDSRICLKASAPRPVTVLAAVVGMATHDKA